MKKLRTHGDLFALGLGTPKMRREAVKRLAYELRNHIDCQGIRHTLYRSETTISHYIQPIIPWAKNPLIPIRVSDHWTKGPANKVFQVVCIYKGPWDSAESIWESYTRFIGIRTIINKNQWDSKDLLASRRFSH